MAGESEDTVSESRSTEDVLSETERLLSETDVPTDSGGDPDATGDPSASPLRPDGSLTKSGDPLESDPRGDERHGRSWHSRLRPTTPSVGLSSYFSIRDFVGLVAVLGVGYAGGGLTVPIAGPLVGLFAVAFAVGLATSKRRYTEVVAAGGAVGAIAAMLNYFVVVVGGLGSGPVLAGMTAGILACLIGYYLGRDLHDGLSREL